MVNFLRLEMALNCPACSKMDAVMLMPTSSLHPGLKRRNSGAIVRCAHCGHVYGWNRAGLYAPQGFAGGAPTPTPTPTPDRVPRPPPVDPPLVGGDDDLRWRGRSR